MPRRDPLPPEVARSLEDLDAAIAGAPGADPELSTLATDVRAVRAEPDPAFLARLDARVLEGFAGTGAPARPPWHARLRRPRLLVPGLGIAAAAVLVVVLATAPGGGGGDASLSTGGGSSAAPGAGSVAAVPARPGAAAEAGGDSGAPSGAAAPKAAVAPSPPLPGPAPDAFGRRRRVERSAELALTTPVDEVQSTADGVVQATQSVGGYVAQSQVQAGDGGGSASFLLRVPARRLDDALARLSRLGHVSSLSQGATDITGSFVTVGRRLGDARAERRALLRALGRATTSQEIESLRARLRMNRSEIAALLAERGRLRHRSATATIAVSVEGSGRRHEGAGGWTPGDALHDAGRVLEVAAGVALVGLAAAIPLALLALPIGLAARATRRRRREAALDGA